MSSTGGDATQILSDVTRGVPGAADRLFPLVYDELRSLAHYRMRGGEGAGLQPTALVHEAYMRLVDRTSAEYNSETHFKAVAARAMRFVMVDRYRREGAEKRGKGLQRVTLHEAIAAEGAPDVDASCLAAALERLAQLDERKARVVELRFLAGLSMNETAEALGISRSTVAEDWQMARAWLACAIEDTEED